MENHIHVYIHMNEYIYIHMSYIYIYIYIYILYTSVKGTCGFDCHGYWEPRPALLLIILDSRTLPGLGVREQEVTRMNCLIQWDRKVATTLLGSAVCARSRSLKPCRLDEAETIEARTLISEVRIVR
jgi:hypothetical protein